MDNRLKGFLDTRFAPGIGFSQLPKSISERRNHIRDTYQASNIHTMAKPGRMLTGAWMDRYIANRVSVNLCDVCARIYGPWLTRPKYSYRPQLSAFKLGDCDGCGGTGQPEKLTSYYPSEHYEDRKLNPNPIYVKKGVM